MRDFSQYLYDVKSAKTALCEFNLAGSTPPIPKVAATITFNTNESRRDQVSQTVLGLIAKLTNAPTARLQLAVGSSSAFLHALAAVTDRSDTVVIESPAYQPFIAAANFLGLKIKRFFRTGNFEADFKSLVKLRKVSKVLVISNPNAPTGLLYTNTELKKLASAFDHLIVDEVFLPLFNAEVTRVAAISNAISISGLSKTLGLSSLRVGWIQASENVLKACDQISMNTYCDVPTLSLEAASAVLPNWKKVIAEQRARIELNRSAIQNFNQQFPKILSHDFSIGHYGVLKIPKRFKTDAGFSAALLKKGVKVCDGKSFGLPESVRISLFLEPQKFAEAIGIIGEFY